MKRLLIFLLLPFVFLLVACNDDVDELAGKTFKIASHSPNLQIDDPNRYEPIVTLEFLDGNVVNTPIYGEGTYELKDNVLHLHFENENETLELSFDLRESDIDFSKYTVEISNVDFEMTDTDVVSNFKDLSIKFNNNIPMEFIEM